MEKEKLRELLQQLHEELEGADRVGGETQQLLKGAMDDIHGALEHSGNGEAVAANASVDDRLRKVAVEFENSHPQLSFTLERLMESLANMGI